MAKRKIMTNAEKKFRRETKKRLIEEGVLKPDKPRLNNKKYIAETIELWNNSDKKPVLELVYAANYMMGHYDRNFRTDKEAVGAAKVLRMALRMAEFYEKLKRENRETFTVGERAEFLKDIFDA